MAHWFHRNPLKATAPVGFELRQVLTSHETGKICSELRLCRGHLLDLLTDPNNDRTAVDTEFRKYFALFQDASGTESKLRPLIRYKWTSSMLGYVPTELSDTWYEILSMTINMALWYTKHAARVAGKDEVTEDEAKEVHISLRKAAGLFCYAQKEKARINEEAESESDLDSRILTAYISQCTAEAQEVTVARAIELKHKADLISALAHETYKHFQTADDSLKQMNVTIFDKWRKYLQLKSQFYLAYAYAYCGESLLGEDKCGEAVRACKEGEKCFEKAEELCKEYGKAKGPGKNAKPENHLFFRQLRPILKRSLDKAERENGMIYHQKVPEQVPELPSKATYGLVKPDDFQPPEPAEIWAPHVYQAFDITKAPMPDFTKSKKGEKELPSVKEAPVYQTDKDPNNHSGCTVS